MPGIKAVVMAGGKGTRLRPITYSIPKPLVPIAGKPCIGYILDSYYSAGIRDAIITTGYKFESLITGVLKYKQNDLSVLFSVEPEPAGTAGSVKLVSRFLDQTFIVGSGDILSDFRIEELLRFHRERKADVTIALTKVDDPSQFGIVETEDGRIVRFLEKPSREETFSNTINAGMYVIEPKILDEIPDGEPYDFAKQLFPRLIKEGYSVMGYECPGTWLDTGRPHDMIKANQMMVSKYGAEVSGESVSGRVIIKTGLHLLANTRIKGPAYIGEGVKIGRNSVIEASAIYDGTVIGEGVQVRNSILMDNVRVLDRTTVSGSVIMRNTTIGEECEISDSVLAPHLNLQSRSRIYNVSLSSEVEEEENSD
ncbi:mannose-1-phosphate guanylyltransferase [Thermogymnomonas acidicola]|uniref:Mannose-1-phosphate guanylyltransferase n=1 Tax=Thermogymnomonas acidicola TaxID=399579 RepID=A0AA37BQE5_9ARCH|nr:NDP-sugar synthase [Thermogymnomonas acidicola]GGM68769.1 mannose-1-phosphate guanylyltransferase [Thermogymnomonas acidicola]